jgi:catechol 2,3-dioxygenase-like lactoylglutathione lyase family enzyme
MTQANNWGIAPFFIVKDVSATLAFYRDKLGFKIFFQGPPDDVFFGIVERNGAMLMFKALGAIVDGKEILVDPIPNFRRKPASSLDAHLYVPDPDALAAEFAARGVHFAAPLTTNDDNLRGFVIEDPDGYGLFFGRPEK